MQLDEEHDGVDDLAQATMPDSFPYKADKMGPRRWIAWAPYILSADAEFLAEDDDSRVAADARIVTRLVAGEDYLLEPTALHGRVGPFTIESGPIPGGNLGIVYFGLSGPGSLPIGSQGGQVCAQTPVFRSVAKAGGGTIGNCDGNLSFTLDELQVGYPNIVKVGATMHLGMWFRDPPAPDGASLSNAVQWAMVCRARGLMRGVWVSLSK